MGWDERALGNNFWSLVRLFYIAYQIVQLQG
jgi:hypothetical protein